MLATGRDDVKSFEAGMLVIAFGAILLLISLFLEWYQPGLDAWEIFEVWDLVLAVLAIAAIVAVASRLGFGPPRPASMVSGPAFAALVIVLYALLDPPPLTTGIDGDPGTGLWLALAATVLMAAGAAMSFARVSVAITRAPAAADPVHPGPDAIVAEPPVGEPAAGGPSTPRAGRRFLRDPPPPPDDPPSPTEPTRRI